MHNMEKVHLHISQAWNVDGKAWGAFELGLRTVQCLQGTYWLFWGLEGMSK